MKLQNPNEYTPDKWDEDGNDRTFTQVGNITLGRHNVP